MQEPHPQLNPFGYTSNSTQFYPDMSPNPYNYYNSSTSTSTSESDHSSPWEENSDPNEKYYYEAEAFDHYPSQWNHTQSQNYDNHQYFHHRPWWNQNQHYTCNLDNVFEVSGQNCANICANESREKVEIGPELNNGEFEKIKENPAYPSTGDELIRGNAANLINTSSTNAAEGGIVNLLGMGPSSSSYNSSSDSSSFFGRFTDSEDVGDEDSNSSGILVKIMIKIKS